MWVTSWGSSPAGLATGDTEVVGDTGTTTGGGNRTGCCAGVHKIAPGWIQTSCARIMKWTSA